VNAHTAADAPPAGPGVSVVICCHNSAGLLPATLKYLTQQVVNPAIPWEVLVVDNASTDDTAAVAEALWPRAHRAHLRVVHEPKLGLAYARARGVGEAAYDIISFVDDDNWLSSTWIQTVYDVMRARPEVGALGGIIEPEFETARPAWFDPVAYLYATGPAGEPAGDVTGLHMLCGAGLSVRQSALADIKRKGFRPISIGRQGGGLGAGEDSEMTYSLRLAGWRLWIDPRLRVRHFLPARRLRWAYARELAYGSAFATPERDALVYACKPPRTGAAQGIRRLRERWFWQLGSAAVEVAASARGLWKRKAAAGNPGDASVLRAEFALGRFRGLLAARQWYNRRSAEIRRVMRAIEAETSNHA
jgi:GT2 family glycosyltransferase